MTKVWRLRRVRTAAAFEVSFFNIGSTMFDWLSRITITCFAASYLICLGLEVSRLFFRAPIRLFVIVGFAGAGLFAQTVYLGMRLQRQLADSAMPRSALPLSSWYDWCLMASWVLALVYIVLAVRRPKFAVGVFMLPLVMAFIGAAYSVHGLEPFSANVARTYWGAVHGVALLFGAVVVVLGAVAGLMYLLQSYRLKHKLPPGRALALPSLEWLQWANERALVVSSLLVTGGLLAGIVLNLTHRSAIDWSSAEVWTSAALLLWLVVVLAFNFLYKPARRGRKVAYLVVASFVFLALELGIVLYTGHAAPRTARIPNRHTCVQLRIRGRFKSVAEVTKPQTHAEILRVQLRGSSFQTPPSPGHFSGELGP